jgi:hypothetical protein
MHAVNPEHGWSPGTRLAVQRTRTSLSRARSHQQPGDPFFFCTPSSAYHRIVAEVANAAGLMVGRRSKFADVRFWNASIAANPTAGGGGVRIAFRDDVWPGYGVLVSIGGDCEHDGSDQSSRQAFDRNH